MSQYKELLKAGAKLLMFSKVDGVGRTTSVVMLMHLSGTVYTLQGVTTRVCEDIEGFQECLKIIDINTPSKEEIEDPTLPESMNIQVGMSSEIQPM